MRTTVGAAANSLETSLYFLSTGVTDSTPGMLSSAAPCSSDSSPMQPTMVRCSPRETVGAQPQLFDALADVVQLGVRDVGDG
jgi:hypothetical protein